VEISLRSLLFVSRVKFKRGDVRFLKRTWHRFCLIILLGFFILLVTACGSEQPNGEGYVTDISEDVENIAYLPEEDLAPAVVNTLFSDMLAQIERQTQVDEMLLAELDSGIYSFDYPLVVVDPYGMSPLSALALFISDEPMSISVYVPGKTEHASVFFALDGYNTRHEVPIYGLYPDEPNMVELTGRTRGGEVRRVVLEIRPDPLPPELARDIIITNLPQPERLQPGFNFTFGHKAAFDVNGEYRWFYNDFTLRGFAMYGYNGHMIFAAGSYHEGDVLLLEVNMLGRVISVYHSPYGMHHDVTDINGRNLLVNGSHGDTVEDFIYEIDVETGEIVNRLDLKRVLQRTRTVGFPEVCTVDWFHHNSTVYYNGDIIISGRRQSAVVRLSWPEGELRWILADHIGWSPMFQKYLLTPVGDYFEWSYGQHDPQILHGFDDDPYTIDILLFDNGNGRFDHDRELQRAVANNEIEAPENYSRMVHYRINERDMTIEQIWQFGKELGYDFFSKGWSNAILLENGNRLGAFDRYDPEMGGNFNANIIEVDYSGNIIWEAFGTSTTEVGGFHVYRVVRLPLYTSAANDLRIDVPARVFIPEDRLP